MNVEARFRVVPHSFASLRGIPWQVCRGCGLVLLRNELTDFCVRHGCEHESHPFYKRELTKLAERNRPK